MKHIKFTWIYLLMLVGLTVEAQVPFAFNYQGIARDAEGTPLSDRDVSLVISIVSGSEDGFIEFSEQHDVRTSVNGLFALRIGEGAYIEGNLRNIEWGLDVYFIRTEIDVEGNDNFIELGNSKLYSVPYALYALEAAETTVGNQNANDDQELSLSGLTLSIEDGNSVDLSSVQDGFIDADADPMNEVQSLGFSGTTLSLSGANSVDLSSLSGGGPDADADPTNELQSLAFSGTTLSLSSTNSVDLSSLRSGGADGDADPTNELQTLSIFGNQLSLSSGNTINLPSGGGSASSIWKEVAPQIIHYTGIEASLGIDEEIPALKLTTDDEDSGIVDLKNNSASSAISSMTMHSGFGFYTFADDSKISNWMGIDDVTGEGFLYLYNDDKLKFNAEATDAGAGRARTYGLNESLNWTISALDGSPNHGYLAMRDDEGQTRVANYVSSSGSGKIFIDGANGNLNNNLTFLAANRNHGYMSVHDAQGNEEAGIYVNSSGQGVVFADIKNFRTPHPLMDDHDIVYASLEGPEAGAYLRGTGDMIDGHGKIKFPDHFQHIISEQGMTIMITPLSAKSKGIAVIVKGKEGFEVQELLEGQGSYQFDWEVKGIRAGFENYEPVRKKDRSKSNSLTEEPSSSKESVRNRPKNDNHK